MMSMKMRIGWKMRIGKRKKTSSSEDSSSSSSSQAKARGRSGEEFGLEIWHCFGLSRRRETTCRYEDDYSVILNSWIERLREVRPPLEEEEEEEEEEEARGGFRLSKCSRSLKDGDRVNLSEILFTEDRDFLITYNDRDRPVKKKQLQGKVVILHFVPLEPWNWILMRCVKSFVDLYDAIKPQGVEVVFIGVTTPKSPQDDFSSLEECFEEKFSVMPWTAIPFTDIIKSQKYFENKLSLSLSNRLGCQPASVVIDPAGVVLQIDAGNYIFEYGAWAYPFSDERIQSLWYEYEEALRHPSITKLLTTPQLNYVINQQNQKIPVSHLEDKVVAFYFYDNYELNDLTEELKRAYQQLDNFEIVLVYIHDSLDSYALETEESFWEIFHTMPWLALPFRDQRSKYLKRLFNYPLSLDGPGPDPRLLIIGPQGKFVEPYGVDILQKFGISAYPFNRKRVAELEVEYTMELKLDMILVNTLSIQKHGYKVKPSQLKGKRILFLIDDGTATIYSNFCNMLKERYLLMKDTEDEFEVIHVPNVNNSSFREYVATMPWLTCSVENKYFVRRLFENGVGLLAFDGDGRVVRRAMYPSIEKGNMDFPFYAGSLESEAFTELIDCFEWDCWLKRV